MTLANIPLDSARALMDERRHWPRYELLDGELLVRNAPTAAHQWAVSELPANSALDTALWLIAARAVAGR